MSGIPDLIALKWSEYLFVEVKTTIWVTSVLQKYIHKKIAENWWTVIVPYWYDDFLTKFLDDKKKIQ